MSKTHQMSQITSEFARPIAMSTFEAHSCFRIFQRDHIRADTRSVDSKNHYDLPIMLPVIVLLTLLTRVYARPLGDDPITAFSLQAFNDNNDVWIMRHVNSGSGSGLLELH